MTSSEPTKIAKTLFLSLETKKKKRFCFRNSKTKLQKKKKILLKASYHKYRKRFLQAFTLHSPVFCPRTIGYSYPITCQEFFFEQRN